MLQTFENSAVFINQSYKIWKKNVPYLYNILLAYELKSCSQSVQWLTETYLENQWEVHGLLIGSNSLTKNYFAVNSVYLPTSDAHVDYSIYKEEKPQTGVMDMGHMGSMGQQNLSIKNQIPQNGSIMRCRVNRMKQNLVVVKVGGGNQQVLVYDMNSHENEIQGSKISLLGHHSEGFGLSWHPNKWNYILSGSFDGKAIVWDINSKGVTGLNGIHQISCQEAIEDVKWSPDTQTMFCSGGQSKAIKIWDIRNDGHKPVISKLAHSQSIYSLDFNSFSPKLLLSASQDSTILLWDLRNMSKKINCFIGHNDSVNCVSWNPYSPLHFATGSSDRKVVIWDMDGINRNTPQKTGNQIMFIHGGHRSKVCDIAWSTQKFALASTEENNIIQVWQMTQSLQPK